MNSIEIYATYNEGKFVVAERFIRTLKNKIFNHMTVVSKNAYFDMLDDILNKCNYTFCRTKKMNPIDVVSDSNAKQNEDFNKKDAKFKVGDRVRISKYKNILAKGYTQKWPEEVFIICKTKRTVPWTYVISDLNGGPIARSFYEKELQKASQGKFRIEKVIKRKGEKLYVK